MYVAISTANNRADVEGVDDLKNLSVQVDQLEDVEALARALGPLGQLDGTENVWLNIQELRTASGRDDDPVWSASFEAMIAFAAKYGWVNGIGTSVRAHIELRDTDD